MCRVILKLLSIVLAFCLSFSLASCTKQHTDNNGISIPSTGLSSTNTSSITSSDDDDYEYKVVVTDKTRHYYKPTSVTVSLYDTETLSYGFAWNTELTPIEPVIQICEGSKFDESKCTEHEADFRAESVYCPNVAIMYFSKAVVPLKKNTTYTYRAYDKQAQIGSEPATFKAVDPKAKSFSFVHVSDSQTEGNAGEIGYSGETTGEYFANTLEAIVKDSPAFMLHTGDIVEWSKYETYWENMLDTNGKILRSLPFMPLSGNHDTTYRSGKKEVFKHFNLKTPDQKSYDKGFYYSFDYGNVRFIMLNTNNITDNGLEDEQYKWLKNTLKSNKKWTIVSMHNPMYSVGKWGANPEQNSTSLKLRKQLAKLFAESKVDLVLQGHDHTYSKTYPIKADGTADQNPTYQTENSVKYIVNPTGTIYAMHGASGNQNRSPYAVDEKLYELGTSSVACSYAEIKVEPDRITVYIKCSDKGRSKILQSYGIIKN